MSSAFLKKLEEEKKQAESGQPIDQDMKEENEESDYDEEADGVKELNEVHDGIGAMALGQGGPVAPTQKMPAVQDPSHAYTKIPKPAGHPGFTQQQQKQAIKYEPTPWTEFFDSKEMLNDVVPIYHAGTEGHVFLCLHGAGHSALSFAALAKILKGDKYKSTCVAFDFRGHGSHFCDDEQELSQKNLMDETITVIKYIAQRYPSQSIIMVGHSMGGSIATKATDFILKNHENETWAKHIKGMFIIDVVEGSALDALPFMESIVKSRPTQFSNLQSVVKYGISSNQVRDLASAKVSMPAQVVAKEDPKTGQTIYVWRTDLLASKQYWTEWFTGLTTCFLDLRIPKQLLLAGNDRMDKDLTIAHMQGKFKMVVCDNVGHVIQEDRPELVAEVFMNYINKFRIPAKHAQQMVITSVSGKTIVINQ